MGQFVEPRTYLVGASRLERDGLTAYLQDTGQQQFLGEVDDALKGGLHEGEVLCSTAAKLCYKSLVLGQNANVTRTRAIADNLKGVIDAGHSSVWGHLCFSFITTNCSRLFTHELIRHEVGSNPDIPESWPGLHEWSQTSGRYVRLDRVDLAWDPILAGCEDLGFKLLGEVEKTVYLLECRTGLRKPNPAHPQAPMEACFAEPCGNLAQTLRWMPVDDKDGFSFDRKKKLTSAIRRFAVNGQVNELFWSANARALRHMVQMRTARGAEWEIRLVFGQVFEAVRRLCPVVFSDAKVELVQGLIEVTGMKTQPYQDVKK